MANDPKSVWQSFVSRGSSDREALFKMIEHYNELHWKNDEQLRGENDMLKKRLKALEAVRQGDESQTGPGRDETCDTQGN